VCDQAVTFARVVGDDAVLLPISDDIPDGIGDARRSPGLDLLCDPHTNVLTDGRWMALCR
jgi:hypothetical protein